MTVALILLAWFVLSIPVALIAGKFIKGRVEDFEMWEQGQ